MLEREALFEDVMQRLEPPRRRLPWAWLSAAGLAAAATAAFLVMRPGVDPEFGPRGQGDSAWFAVHCASPDACDRRLRFELDAPEARPFFASFARGPDGTVVWFYPAPDATMPSAAEAHAGALWASEARIPDESPEGAYEVFAVFAERPLTRPELKQALGDDLRGDGSVSLVRRAVNVFDRAETDEREELP